jgi:hypothetical protein
MPLEAMMMLGRSVSTSAFDSCAELTGVNRALTPASPQLLVGFGPMRLVIRVPLMVSGCRRISISEAPLRPEQPISSSAQPSRMPDDDLAAPLWVSLMIRAAPGHRRHQKCRRLPEG